MKRTKIKPLQSDQLPIDELMPDAPESEHKLIKKALKREALYRVRK